MRKIGPIAGSIVAAVVGPITGEAIIKTLSFISTWDTTGASETVTLPATSASNSFDVDWGDGSAIETITAASPSHVYATADTYEITISGTCPTWSFNNVGDKLKIKDIKQWGEIGLTSLAGGFYGCTNMTTTATDSGGFGSVTAMDSMFRSATLANPSVALWNVGSVTDMTSMFLSASAANPDVSLWDVGSVAAMGNMFRSATIANPDVSLWNVSSVTNMASMFRLAPAANPDVSSWNVSSVTLMGSMFQSAVTANPEVSSWDVSLVTDMTSMFATSAFSNANYDLLLAAWSLLTLKSSVPFHAGTAQYTEVAARAVLTGTYLWVITDGGPA